MPTADRRRFARAIAAISPGASSKSSMRAGFPVRSTRAVTPSPFSEWRTPSVSSDDAAYASKVEGTNTTIVLADFYAKHSDKDLIKKIAADALRLAADLH